MTFCEHIHAPKVMKPLDCNYPMAFIFCHPQHKLYNLAALMAQNN